MHVLELGAFAREGGLDADARALGELPAAAWEALTRGDDVVLTAGALVLAEHGPHGVERVRIHDRSTWESSADRAGLALVARGSTAVCDRPASPDLCWQPVRVPRTRRHLLAGSTIFAGALFAGSLAALLLGYTRDRRRMHLDRVHVLRTLTHEIRTPATSLRLDIEPLRAAYDELPANCQEPMLRLSDGIERLCRGLDASARFLALFEPHGATRAELVRATSFSSTRALLAELSESWPEGASLVAASDDASIVIDATWLGVALKNLVENAVRHGRMPIVVAWTRAGDELVVRVEDGGETRGFSLARAITPFGRGDESQGLGLGLAMVARIAELLGGKLTHAPAPTAFTLRVQAGARATRIAS
jgi:signal transduction histidine kinase